MVLEALIKTDGTCRVVRIVESPHELLSTPATEAVEQWKWEPGLDPQGNPVNMEFSLTIKFALK